MNTSEALCKNEKLWSYRRIVCAVYVKLNNQPLAVASDLAKGM